MIVLSNEIIKEFANNMDYGKVIDAGECIYDYIKSKNPYDNITLALKSIKKDLEDVLIKHPNYFSFGQISLNLTLEVLNELEWEPLEGSNNDVIFKSKYRWHDYIYSLIYYHGSGFTVISR